MMDWVNATITKLQAGDVATVVMVLIAILVFFFIAKILLSTVKAILIIIAFLVIAAFFMPEAGILERAAEITLGASHYISDTIGDKISSP